jgi:hypothetical protein
VLPDRERRGVPTHALREATPSPGRCDDDPDVPWLVVEVVEVGRRDQDPVLEEAEHVRRWSSHPDSAQSASPHVAEVDPEQMGVVVGQG